MSEADAPAITPDEVFTRGQAEPLRVFRLYRLRRDFIRGPVPEPAHFPAGAAARPRPRFPHHPEAE